MSSRTPNQEKALRWFVETNDLRPQLSTHPVYYFVDKKSGKERKELMSHIVMNWEESRKRKKTTV